MANPIRQNAEEFQLVETIALNKLVDRESVLLFDNLESFITDVLQKFYTSKSNLIVSAPVISAIPIAADRAEVSVIEVQPKNPFAPDTEILSKSIKSKSDIVYLANPNRLTGATYSNFQIKELARNLEEGILIIDEYYSDFSGLSSLPLTGILSNLIVIKTFDSWSDSRRAEQGYAIVSEEFIGRLDSSFNTNKLKRIVAKNCLEKFTDKTSQSRVKQIQHEMLVTATALTNLGLRCQITASDSLVIYSPDAESLCKSLSEYGITTGKIQINENADEIILYRVSTPENNRLFEQALMKLLTRKVPKPKREAVPA